MNASFVKLKISPPRAEAILNNPDKRNALGTAMFDELEQALAEVADRDDIHVTLLHGEGKVFCAGFDLAAAVDEPQLMGAYIRRLSELNRKLRRLDQVVVAAVQGAAIAGGCALLSACDFVVVSRSATLGYPVHAIGVSPAVTIPTLQQAIGPGAARSLLLSGELIKGEQAKRMNLATHLADGDESLFEEADTLCEALSGKGPRALRATKAWMNELDGSVDDATCAAASQASAALAGGEEAVSMLGSFWRKRREK